ncbi:Cyclin_N domain-containing protein/Cyclin_C domain-containing protein [Cephalotus follicularis]|uniref:B-like cyclin n=1 Tax=Cephalotus follicularis TaxID=3775 RepID=A0A1Q3CT22_CEPFO|nr:Cyclin_N domain-containing protein/Cyclin_C domain-containing protein [Cephalotus follicularis]
MEFDLENPLTNVDDHHFETTLLPSLFLAESDHMPSMHYLKTLKAKDFDVSLRRETISSILQVSCNIDPYLSYLAVNYLDRYLANQGMLQPKPWIIRLLAVSCVSLAAKMKKTELSHTDFLGDGGFIFDTQTVERMEHLILGSLQWRMRSITPFSFISFFISLFKLKDPPLRQALKARATEIIFKAQNDIKLLEFKPSVIAASALLSASHELFPLQFSCFKKSIANFSYVNKEKMSQCYNVIQEIAMDGYESVFDTLSSSETPVNVLDRHFSSSQSDKTNSTITTSASTVTLRPEKDNKRRKISSDYDHCNNHKNTFQLSNT